MSFTPPAHSFIIGPAVINTHTHAAFGWRIHCGVEVTELSTNKQHSLSPIQTIPAPTDENWTKTITQTPSDVQSRRAPALINTCHDARFAPHVGANVNAG